MEPVRSRGLEDDVRSRDVPIDDHQPLQWGLFEYLPVTVQDVTGEVLMVQYMTEEGLERAFKRGPGYGVDRANASGWPARRRRYDLVDLRANCMGDSLLAIVDAGRRLGCHLGNRSCFSVPISLDDRGNRQPRSSTSRADPMSL